MRQLRRLPALLPRCPAIWGAVAFIAVMAGPASAQAPSAGYQNSAALERAIDQLAKAHRNVVDVTVVARSPGNRPVRALRLGAGKDPDGRPALLVLANAFGPHVVGSEVAMRVANQLAAAYGTDPAVTALLDTRTIYVVPRVNPDAAEAFFRSPLYEQVRNDGAADDDHDWQVDEDGPEDLNGDGLITMMRVRDPAGDWMPDSAHPALLRKADRAKGQVGVYRLYTEGRDNDQDQAWNEDPSGSTDVGANFTHGYRYFGDATGLYPMSAPETKGVADFFIAHPNIAAVYVLGPQDNLLLPWKHDRTPGIGGKEQGTAAGGPYTSVLGADQPFFEETAARFRKATSLESGPSSADLAGDPLSWAYYDMGRWAFGSRVWWIPGTAVADTAAGGGKAPAAQDSNKAESDAYRWVGANVPSGFVAWTRVEHPDFPGQEVEIGGFAPFVGINPPAALLDSLSRGQLAFVIGLAEALPRITLRNATVTAVGARTYRIEVELANEGYFPTLSAIGVKAAWPQRIRLVLDPGTQRIVGGRAVEMVGPIAGNGASAKFRWVVVGEPGATVAITASSPVAGSATRTLKLR